MIVLLGVPVYFAWKPEDSEGCLTAEHAAAR